MWITTVPWTIDRKWAEHWTSCTLNISHIPPHISWLWSSSPVLLECVGNFQPETGSTQPSKTCSEISISAPELTVKHAGSPWSSVHSTHAHLGLLTHFWNTSSTLLGWLTLLESGCSVSLQCSLVVHVHEVGLTVLSWGPFWISSKLGFSTYREAHLHFYSFPIPTVMTHGR